MEDNSNIFNTLRDLYRNKTTNLEHVADKILSSHISILTKQLEEGHSVDRYHIDVPRECRARELHYSSFQAVKRYVVSKLRHKGFTIEEVEYDRLYYCVTFSGWATPVEDINLPEYQVKVV